MSLEEDHHDDLEDLLEPTGLVRIREDIEEDIKEDIEPDIDGISKDTNKNDIKNDNGFRVPRANQFENLASLNDFPSQSLHSFSFTASEFNKALESRRTILSKSISYIKSKALSSLKSSFEIAPTKEFEIKPDVLPTSSSLDSGLDAAKALTKTTENNRIRSTADESNSIKPSISIKTRGLSHIYASPTSAALSAGAYSLHSPSRFSPKHHATLTTNEKLNVLTANDVALYLFGADREDLVGSDILQLLYGPHREKQKKLIDKKSRMDIEGEIGKVKSTIITCGKVVKIQKKDGTIASASLWLKQKILDGEGIILIWIFEEVAESNVTLIIDQNVKGFLSFFFFLFFYIYISTFIIVLPIIFLIFCHFLIFTFLS